MKYLQKNEINLVHPKFRKLILDAWKGNEKVPYGVVYLTYNKPSKKDIKIVKKIITAALKCSNKYEKK